jgi:hypothetical protein
MSLLHLDDGAQTRIETTDRHIHPVDHFGP